MIVIIPRSEIAAAQTIIDSEGIAFSSMIWRHNVPDPATSDIGKGIRLSADGSRPVTHLMVCGDVTTRQGRALSNVSGIRLYKEPQWTRRAALTDAGLRPVSQEEPTRNHHMRMPNMHKIWDMADAPVDVAICAASDKWDGYTCSLKYKAGSLVEGLTQGDLVCGCDRTDRLATLVPTTLNRAATMQIEGEVITNTNDPRDAYRAMHDATEREFAALQCKLLVFNVRGLPFATWTEAMTWLDSQGFDTVLNHTDPAYPKDGIVYRIDNFADHDAAPIGMFAYKF